MSITDAAVKSEAQQRGVPVHADIDTLLNAPDLPSSGIPVPPQRYPTGEQRWCEPCVLNGRRRLGVTRGAGLRACRNCWSEHLFSVGQPSAAAPHNLESCRVCHPAITPEMADEDSAPTRQQGDVGSATPRNLGPTPANRPTGGDPWFVVDVVKALADEHAASGHCRRPGHTIGQPEIKVAAVYAEMTSWYGPVVRPTVAYIAERAGICVRAVSAARTALIRRGVLLEHSAGAVMNGERYASECELRIPLSHMTRSQLQDELDERVGRAQLLTYLEVLATERDGTVEPAAPSRDRRVEEKDAETSTNDIVDNQCTPLSRVSFHEELPKPHTAKNFDENGVLQRRARRSFALARNLRQRQTRWLAAPLPLLAAALAPLADAGWSAYQVDTAAAVFGPVTSGSGLVRIAAEISQRHRQQADELRRRLAAGPPRAYFDVRSELESQHQTKSVRESSWQNLKRITPKVASWIGADSTPPPSTRSKSDVIRARALARKRFESR
jgi:hypothetical protein